MQRVLRKLSYRDIGIALGCLLGIVWFSYLIVGIVGKEERARHDVSDTRTELDSLSSREKTLTADLSELETPRGQEAVLRDTLGVARPGEEVIIVVPREVAPAAPTPLPWWKKVLMWF